MLHYKNIVFDFGNVLGSFDEDYILRQFCSDPADLPLLKKAVFYNWADLDAGTADYEASKKHALTLVPARLRANVTSFFEEWYRHLTPVEEIWNLVHELKKQGASVYILSNAPTHFAEHADFYEIVNVFDGIVFSAPLRMAKPEPEIYQHLFHKYDLKPEECFFLDDRKNNISAGRALGMDGIVFDGDMNAVRKALGL